MPSTILCPHCHQTVSVDEALEHQIQAKLQQEFQDQLKHKDQQLADLEQSVPKQLAEKLKLETEKITKSAKAEAAQQLADQLQTLQKETAEKDRLLQLARKSELEIRKQMVKLEDDKKAFELEKQRQMDAERQSIRQQAQTELIEQQRLKEKEKDKIISDLKMALEDAQRKANQGSQQLQGEVMELDLEDLLKQAFPQDQIQPIGKGVMGADIKHTVCSPRGRPCGVILWESKRTKLWTDQWLSKLKSDLRQQKADISAIVSTALPSEAANGLGLKDGVWIANYPMFLPLATLLRKSLLDAGYQKAVSEHQGRKADLIYDYITGHEFRQQIESLAEAYQEMKHQLDREKTAFEKIWKQREGQIKRLLSATVNIYGSVQGLAGSSSVHQVKGLELPELESGDQTSLL